MNLNVKRVGFWSEEGWSFRCLDEDVVDTMDERFEPSERILAYLDSGIPVVAIRTMSYNKFTREMFGPVTAYTDGTWAWTNILIHYYSRGLLKLPSAFEEHITNSSLIMLKISVLSNEAKAKIAAFVSDPNSPVVPCQ